MSTFQERLKTLIGQRGYEPSMRRSLQSVVLQEAKRCVAPRFSSLRPFQRKVAFMDQAHALVETLDFLFDHQKHEILWRTATSKEQLLPDFAWKRLKLMDKELQGLASQAKPFMARGRTHDETCDLLVQSIYETVSGNKGKPHPLHWEHAHNHCMMAFRLYYRGDRLDPSFPEPILPREIVVPAEKPKPNVDTTPYYIQVSSNGNSKKNGNSSSKSNHSMMPPPAAGAASLKESHHTGSADDLDDSNGMNDDGDNEPLDVAALIGDSNPAQDRRKILKEVREHLDLLKEFEGIISDEDLIKRKRELYLALPSAPPSFLSPSKKAKL